MIDARKYNEYTDADQLTLFDAEDNRLKRIVDGYVFKSEEDAKYFAENEMQLIGNIMFFSNTTYWDEGPITRLQKYFLDDKFVLLIEIFFWKTICVFGFCKALIINVDLFDFGKLSTC